MDIHERLKAQGLELPNMAAALAKYVPALQSGNHVFVSGQLCTKDGQLLAEGPVPSRVSAEEAQAAARQCVLNALAAIDRVLEGDWSRFVRVVRVGVYVNSDASFNEQHHVANGASELLGDLFGDQGQHVRAAVGCSSLPMNATVEAELMVEVR
ncbi:MAG: RidA family protein [Phycisphaeraceae bacterium]